MTLTLTLSEYWDLVSALRIAGAIGDQELEKRYTALRDNLHSQVAAAIESTQLERQLRASIDYVNARKKGN